jgi:hypothetical protein
MALDQTRIKKLQELLKLTSEGLTREEFASAFKAAMDLILKVEKKQDDKFSQSLDDLKKQIENIANQKEKDISGLRDDLINRVDKSIQAQKSNLDLMWEKVNGVEDGKDADSVQIVQDVLAQIKLPEYKETVLDSPEQLRDKLELLKGNERLDKSAIKGLDELIKELEGKISKGGRIGGGGFNYGALTIHQTFDETPVNSGDNINFTIAIAPNPTNSLRLYRNGQRLKIGASNDYTVSGHTITLLTAFSAGEILTADYQT